MARPNPTLREIDRWLNELPTIEDLKQVPGFEISKPYFFVRMGGKWHIGKENPYVDVKNIAGKPDNIQCFADGPDINKRLVGKRDSESGSLNTVKIQATKREIDKLDKLLLGMGLRKEFVEFTWERTPREIYEEQIEAYKKLHNINHGFQKILFFSIFFAAIAGMGVIYLYENKFTLPFITNQSQTPNADIIDKLSVEYQKLPLNKKIVFLRRTGLSTVSDSRSTLEKQSLRDFISRYFAKNKALSDDPARRDSFFKKLSNEIGLSIAQKI